jgi:hypothetical protein
MSEPDPPRRWGIPVLIAMGVGLIVLWWSTGALDRPLSSIGLNKNPCIVSLFGGTLCGDDAERVCSSELLGQAPACRELRGETAESPAEVTPAEPTIIDTDGDGVPDDLDNHPYDADKQ